MSTFSFVDEVTELKKNEKLTAFYSLKGSEEFLKDHFEGFPVMPGVLLLEALKQAASLLLVVSEDFNEPFFRLTSAGEVKFGQFVKPGARLCLSARLLKREGRERFFEGRIDLKNGQPSGASKAKALSCSFTLAPVNCSDREKARLRQNARSQIEKIHFWSTLK